MPKRVVPADRGPSREVRCIAVLALLFLLASCDSITGVFRSASLEVTAYGEIGNPKGLAGLEIQVGNRVFTAADLPSARFEWPNAARCTSRLRCARRGSSRPRVAGRGRLSLMSSGSSKSSVQIYPSGAPPGHPPTNLHTPNPDCYWFWCSKVWRWELKEGTAQPRGRGGLDHALARPSRRVRGSLLTSRSNQTTALPIVPSPVTLRCPSR